MKAKVHFKNQGIDGSFTISEDGFTFREWCLEVGKAHAGNGFFAGNDLSFPVQSITYIERVED